jgi:hypothetical protein
MIYHDLAFETLAKAPVKQTDVIVARQIQDPYGWYDDGVITWTSSNILMSVNIDIVGQMLGQATKKATVRLLGIVDDVAAGDVFQIRFGLYNQDPSVSGFDYLSEGFFIIDEIDFDYEAGSTTVTLYDQMWKAGKTKYKEAVPSNALTYPISVEDFATHIASLLNVELMAGFNTLPNYDYMILEDLYTDIAGSTLQTAIMDVAGATGTTARMSDTTLVFSQYSVNSENLVSDDLKKLTIGDTYGPVTSVILGRTPQNDNIAIAAATPTFLDITSIDTSTNQLTITDSGMVAGNMVFITSTGTLPAPLQENTPYYTYMVTDDDVFKLMPTYADAIANTNTIDLTTTGTGTVSLVPIVTKEIQINNNEIVDDDRQDLLPPLYNTLAGIYWTDVKAETIGLGWHEVGDVIQFTQGATTVRAFINEIHLALAGSIQESLTSTVPNVATIDYQTAGGVIKTLYNTEIKVDKQGQDITSVVSQQIIDEQNTQTNFTEIYQNISDILLTIQRAGGGNLLLNSVGFAKETATDNASVSYDKLSFWDYNPSYQISTHGTVTSYSSSESQNAGGISGQVIQMTGASVYITQRVNVAANTSLSFGLRVKNAIGDGDATITLSNTNDTFTLTIDDTNTYDWEELKIEDFTSTMSWLDIKIQVSSATHLMFTDLRLLYGSSLQGWVQSPSEILSTNVQFSTQGMKIFDNVHDTETQVTYNEFSTRRKADNVILFEADDSGVVTNDLGIKGATSHISGTDTVIRQITIPKSSALAGIAFIKVS